MAWAFSKQHGGLLEFHGALKSSTVGAALPETVDEIAEEFELEEVSAPDFAPRPDDVPPKPVVADDCADGAPGAAAAKGRDPDAASDASEEVIGPSRNEGGQQPQQGGAAAGPAKRRRGGFQPLVGIAKKQQPQEKNKSRPKQKKAKKGAKEMRRGALRKLLFTATPVKGKKGAGGGGDDEEHDPEMDCAVAETPPPAAFRPLRAEMEEQELEQQPVQHEVPAQLGHVGAYIDGGGDSSDDGDDSDSEDEEGEVIPKTAEKKVPAEGGSEGPALQRHPSFAFCLEEAENAQKPAAAAKGAAADTWLKPATVRLPLKARQQQQKQQQKQQRPPVAVFGLGSRPGSSSFAFPVLPKEVAVAEEEAASPPLNVQKQPEPQSAPASRKSERLQRKSLGGMNMEEEEVLDGAEQEKHVEVDTAVAVDQEAASPLLNVQKQPEPQSAPASRRSERLQRKSLGGMNMEEEGVLRGGEEEKQDEVDTAVAADQEAASPLLNVQKQPEPQSAPASRKSERLQRKSLGGMNMEEEGVLRGGEEEKQDEVDTAVAADQEAASPLLNVQKQPEPQSAPASRRSGRQQRKSLGGMNMEEEGVLRGGEQEKNIEVDTAAAVSGGDTGARLEGRRSSAGKGLDRLPFEEAREVVWRLDLRSAHPSCKASTAWLYWRRKNPERRRELRLPSEPDKAYTKEEGFDWDDFVGGGVAEVVMEATEEEPMEAMETAMGPEDGGSMASGGQGPQMHEKASEEQREEPPAASSVPDEGPQQQKGRRKSGAAGKKIDWLPFEEARAMIWTFDLRSTYPSCTAKTAWGKWCQANDTSRKELRLPTKPWDVYKDEDFVLDHFMFGCKEQEGLKASEVEGLQTDEKGEPMVQTTEDLQEEPPAASASALEACNQQRAEEERPQTVDEGEEEHLQSLQASIEAEKDSEAGEWLPFEEAREFVWSLRLPRKKGNPRKVFWMERKKPGSALSTHPGIHGNPPRIYGKSNDGEDSGWTGWEDFVYGYEAVSGQRPEQQVEAEAPTEAPVHGDEEEEVPRQPGRRRSTRRSSVSALEDCNQQRGEEAQEGGGEASAPAAESMDEQVTLMWGETGGEETQSLPEGAAGSENGRRPKAMDHEQQRPGAAPTRRITRRQSGAFVEGPQNRESLPRRASKAIPTEDPAAAAAEKPSRTSTEAEMGTVSFKEARSRVWSLRLGKDAGPGAGEHCWLNWCSRNGRHRVMRGLPSRPHEDYHGEWKDYDDFVLGWKAAEAQREENQAPEESQGQPVPEASGAKEDLEATEKNQEEATTATVPDEGQARRSSAAGNRVGWLSYEEARKLVRSLDLRSANPSSSARAAWNKWCQTNKTKRKNLRLPTAPHRVYKDGGFEWDDFVGGGEAESASAVEEAAVEAEAVGEEEEAVGEEEEAVGEEEEHLNATEEHPEGPADATGSLHEAEEAVPEEEEHLNAAEEPRKEPAAAPVSDEGQEQTRRSSSAAGDRVGWLSYEAARELVRGLDLRSANPSSSARTAWNKWCQTNKTKRKNLRLPTAPHKVYKEDGFDWDDFVGGGEAESASAVEDASVEEAGQDEDEAVGEEEEHLNATEEHPEGPADATGSLHEAEEAVPEEEEHLNAAKEPRKEPAAAATASDGQEQTRRTSSAAGDRVGWLSYEAARKLVRSLDLRSANPSSSARTAWNKWCQTNKTKRKNVRLPANPDRIYKDDGFEWDDFVGGGAAERASAVEEAATEAGAAREEDHEDSRAAEECLEEPPPASVPEGSEQRQKRRKSSAAGKNWLPFEEALALVWTFDLRSVYPSNAARTAWEKWYLANRNRRLELRLPTNPGSVYANEKGFDWDDFVFGSTEKGEASGAASNPGKLTRKRPRQQEDSGDKEPQEAPERPRRRSGSANKTSVTSAAAELPRQVDDTLGFVPTLRTRGQHMTVNLTLEEPPLPTKAPGSSTVLSRRNGAPASPGGDGGAELETVAEEQPKQRQEAVLEAPRSPAAVEIHGDGLGDAAAPAAVADASDGGGQGKRAGDAPEAEPATETTQPTNAPETTPPTEADGAPVPAAAAAAAAEPPPMVTPVAGVGPPRATGRIFWGMVPPSPVAFLGSLGDVVGGVVRSVLGAGRSPAPGSSAAPGRRGTTAAATSPAADSTADIYSALPPLDRSIAEEPDEPEHLSRRQLQADVSSRLGRAAGEQEATAAAKCSSPSPVPWHQAYRDGSGPLSQQQEAEQGDLAPTQRLPFDNPGLGEVVDAAVRRRQSLRSGTVIAGTPESSCGGGSRRSKRGRQSLESVPEVDSGMRRTRRQRLSQQHGF